MSTLNINNDYIHLNSASSDKVVVEGNLGIGTTSPGDPLHISSGGNDDFIRIENTNTYTGLWMNDNGTNNGWLVMSGYTNTSSPGDFAIREYGVQTSLVIKQSSGNVGIGGISPVYKLDVNGTGLFRDHLRIVDNKQLLMGSGDQFQIGHKATYSQIATYEGDLIIDNNATDESIVFRTDDGSGGLAEYFRLDGATTNAYFSNAGNVGIGTSSPDYKLDVNGTIGFPYSGSNANYIEQGNSFGYGQIIPFNNSGLFSFDTNYTAGGGYDFAYNGSSIIRVKSNGNVGIGTTSPSTKLDVNGVITATGGNSTNWNTAYGWGDHASAGYLTSYTETQTLDDVTTLGDTTTNAITVGGLTVNASDATIGNSSQQTTELNIIATNTAGAPAWTTAISMQGYEGRGQGIFFTDTSNASEEWFAGINYGNNWDTYSIGYDASGGQAEYTANAILTVKNNGNVGIGTTSPAQKLHVAGAIYSTAFVYGEAHLAFTEFRVRNNENYRLGTNGTDFRLNSVNDITFSTTTSYTERLRITSSGDVGIGTTTPGAKLQINGATADGTANALIVRNSALTSLFSIRNDGRVDIPAAALVQSGGGYANTSSNSSYFTGNLGIGTSSPAYKLDVKGVSATLSDGNQIFSVGNTTGGTQLAFGSLENSYNWIRSYESGAGGRDFVLGTNAEVMRLTASGNVGIGTTSPTAKLHINGTFKSIGIQDSSTSQAIFINGNAEVGIGTTSPTTKLHVNGTARVVKSKIDITPTSDTIALDVRGTGTPNDYFTVSNATGGANDVFLPIFFYKAATYGYNGGTNRYPSGVYGGGFVAAVDDTSYPSAAGAGAAMHFNARTYANNGPLTSRYLFSWGSWLTTHMAMTAGGNLLIGKTSDNGEKLQVNGNADVSGDVNADGDFYQNGAQGWSGTINIPTNPPVTITVQGGIITNVT